MVCVVSQDASESLGISIAGGVQSPRGNTPVYVTNINPGGCIGRCRQVKVGACISRVPDQNGVSQAWYIVEIRHSGRKPSIYMKNFFFMFATNKKKIGGLKKDLFTSE